MTDGANTRMTDGANTRMTDGARFVELPGEPPEEFDARRVWAEIGRICPPAALRHGDIVGWAERFRGRSLYIVRGDAPDKLQLLDLFVLSDCEHGHIPATMSRAFKDPLEHYINLMDQDVIECVEVLAPNGRIVVHGLCREQ